MRRKIVDIIFLDFDGVIWTVSNEYRKRHRQTNRAYRRLTTTQKRTLRHELDPIACSNLDMLLEWCPKARIVVSSTWRKGRTLKQLERILVNSGVRNAKGRVIGMTPGSKDGFRGREIKAWLKHPTVRRKLKVHKYVIIDDDSDFLDSQLDRFVHTDVCSGFTIQEAGLAAFILGERDHSFGMCRYLEYGRERMNRMRTKRPRLFAKLDKMLALRDKNHKARQKRVIARMRRQRGKKA